MTGVYYLSTKGWASLQQELVTKMCRKYYPWLIKYFKNIIYSGWLPGDWVVKNMSGNAGDAGSSPGMGRPPAERNGNPLQYSGLGNPMDRGAWWATVHGGVAKSNTTDQLIVSLSHIYSQYTTTWTKHLTGNSHLKCRICQVMDR